MIDHNILTELDAIIDTRIGTIAKHDAKLAIEIFKGDRYKERLSDWFMQDGALPFDYKASYQSRDIDTLQKSKMSNFIYVVKQTLAEAFVNAGQGMHRDPVLYVNTYPYDLTDDEIEEYRVSIQAIISEPVQIKMAYISHQDLTMRLIKKNFVKLMFYNFSDWLDAQIEDMDKDLEASKNPDLLVVAPAIFSGIHPKSKEEVDQLREGLPHPFVVFISNIAPIFKLDMVDIKYYSMVDPTDIVRSTKSQK